jgi:hypothetical protein
MLYLILYSVVLQEIPWEELEADDADKVISVFHFSKEVQRTHGVPFKFVVKPVGPRVSGRENCAEPETRGNALQIRKSGFRLGLALPTKTFHGSDLR